MSSLFDAIKQEVNAGKTGTAEAGKKVVESIGGGQPQAPAKTPTKKKSFLTPESVQMFQNIGDEDKENMSRFAKFRKLVMDSNRYKVPVYDREAVKAFREEKEATGQYTAAQIRVLVQQAQESGVFGKPELASRGGRKIAGVLFDRPILRTWKGDDPNDIRYETTCMKIDDFYNFMAVRTKLYLGGELDSNQGIRIEFVQRTYRGTVKIQGTIVARNAQLAEEFKNPDSVWVTAAKIFQLNADGTRVIDEEKTKVNDIGYKTVRYAFDWNEDEHIRAAFERKGKKNANAIVEGGTAEEMDRLEASYNSLQDFIAGNFY
mgnify:FL=1